MKSSFDENFAKINALKWLPWVGDQFSSLQYDNRLLIVGESHYHDNSETSINNHNSPILTREVIDEMAIDRCYYGTKIFPNFHRAILGNDEFDSLKFWNLVSFYNFIQRPMNTNKERPNYDDYYYGWKNFFEIIEILKPKTCIFIGTTAANSLIHSVQDSNFKSTEVIWEDYISNAYAKTAIINQDNYSLNIIFIRHTSQMFSWPAWHEYLLKKIPDKIKWLSEGVQA